MKIKITRHNAGTPVHVGFVTIDRDDLSVSEIDAIANEDGISELVTMGESTLPADYDWTGDEVYEVVAS